MSFPPLLPYLPVRSPVRPEPICPAPRLSIRWFSCLAANLLTRTGLPLCFQAWSRFPPPPPCGSFLFLLGSARLSAFLVYTPLKRSQKVNLFAGRRDSLPLSLCLLHPILHPSNRCFFFLRPRSISLLFSPPDSSLLPDRSENWLSIPLTLRRPLSPRCPLVFFSVTEVPPAFHGMAGVSSLRR